MIRHHPPDELLLDHASGAQPAALALAIGAHLELCPDCRRMVAACEALGGLLLDGVEPAAIEASALDACLARLGAPPAVGSIPRTGCARDPRVPAVLRPHLGAGLDRLPWESIGGLFGEVKLGPFGRGYRVSLLRVGPGGHVPEHGHAGNEYMLVLAGGYTSGGRHYGVGDFSACDGSEDHTPVADAGADCICLLVLDAPLAFRSTEGQRIAPLLSM